MQADQIAVKMRWTPKFNFLLNLLLSLDREHIPSLSFLAVLAGHCFVSVTPHLRLLLEPSSLLDCTIFDI